jgi:hypothetical protein
LGGKVSATKDISQLKQEIEKGAFFQPHYFILITSQSTPPPNIENITRNRMAEHDSKDALLLQEAGHKVPTWLDM